MKHVEGQSATRRQPAKKSLGDILIEENLITPEQLESALKAQRRHGGRLSDVLLKQGVINTEQMAIILSIQLNLPLIDLKRHTVQPRALALVPEEIARKHTLIPLDIINDSLLVVMADPEDVSTVEDVRARAGIKVEVALGLRAEIERAIDLNYRSSGAIAGKVDALAAAAGKTGNAAALTAKTPAAETLDLLIIEAVKDRASDIHIEPQEERLRIRYRIDGVLHDMYSLPLHLHAAIVSRIKVLSSMDISEQRRPQEGRFSIKLGGHDVDIGAATMETPGGERVTLRILDKALALFTLAELGLQPGVLKTYRSILNSPQGMVLVGGPTGSGKTTTLYASINELDRNERNIMTIEDPIEYNFMDVNQAQVNARAGLTFASGLRAILRHDPDVILIGEIRDRETVTAAILSALTGHLMLSSIQAGDAVGVLSRLLDLDVEPASISSTLIGILAQRMVRRICPNCKALYQPSDEELRAFSLETGAAAPTFYQGAGCNLCANTGYRGRTGIFELLVMSETIRQMLRSHAGAGEIRAQAISEGMLTMRQDSMAKARDGITSIGEVMRSVFSIS
jgi:type IV pilus assembly protein PilB